MLTPNTPVWRQRASHSQLVLVSWYHYIMSNSPRNIWSQYQNMDSRRQRGRHSNYMIVCTDNYLRSRPLTVIKELSECCLMEALRGGGGGLWPSLFIVLIDWLSSSPSLAVTVSQPLPLVMRLVTPHMTSSSQHHTPLVSPYNVLSLPRQWLITHILDHH